MQLISHEKGFVEERRGTEVEIDRQVFHNGFLTKGTRSAWGVIQTDDGSGGPRTNIMDSLRNNQAFMRRQR